MQTREAGRHNGNVKLITLLCLRALNPFAEIYAHTGVIITVHVTLHIHIHTHTYQTHTHIYIRAYATRGSVCIILCPRTGVVPGYALPFILADRRRDCCNKLEHNGAPHRRRRAVAVTFNSLLLI